MTIPFISEQNSCFLEPKLASDDGLVGWGEEISESLVLKAYERGIFPWYGKDNPVLWWSPNPRAVFFPNQIKISRSLKKNAKKYSVSFNQNFEKVIQSCKSVREIKNEETWINEDIIKIYTSLRKKGIANSVEVYENNELIGGLYGLQIGSIFCGESMFSTKTDASKVALINLAKKLISQHFTLIDAQIPNPHLSSLGAVNLPRDKFLSYLEEAKKYSIKL